MSKKRILIVEDEALTVLALQQELAELGYEIAGDASTAVDRTVAPMDAYFVRSVRQRGSSRMDGSAPEQIMRKRLSQLILVSL